MRVGDKIKIELIRQKSRSIKIKVEEGNKKHEVISRDQGKREWGIDK